MAGVTVLEPVGRLSERKWDGGESLKDAWVPGRNGGGCNSEVGGSGCALLVTTLLLLREIGPGGDWSEPSDAAGTTWDGGVRVEDWAGATMELRSSEEGMRW